MADNRNRATRMRNFLFFVLSFAACVLVSEADRFRRQESVAPSPSPATTESFDDFLNEMLENLGLDSPDPELTKGDTLVNVTDSPVQSNVSNTTTPNPIRDVNTNNNTNTAAPTGGSYTTGTTQSIVATDEGSLSQIPNTPNTASDATASLIPSTSPWVPESSEDPSSQVPETGSIISSLSPSSSWVPPDSGTGSPVYSSFSSAAPSPPPSSVSSDNSDDLNPNCQVRPKLSDFCIIPDDMQDFLGPSADLHDMSDFVVSMHLVTELTHKCPPGSWCLSTAHAYKHIEEKMAFWSNSSKFTDLCWQPLDGCLRSIVEYYADCHIYQMYDLIVETKKLLCEMREEPMASRDCMEQTMKALHVSMADLHRDDISTQRDADTCNSRNAMMTANYLCAVNVCGEYTDLLNQFKPWEYFMSDVTSLTDKCNYDNDKCTPEIEEEADEAEEEETNESEGGGTGSSDSNDESEENWGTTVEPSNDDRQYNAILALSTMDFPTIMVIGAVMVAALGFFLLLGVVWCLRRRKSRHRVREGVEYMEILPDMDD